MNSVCCGFGFLTCHSVALSGLIIGCTFFVTPSSVLSVYFFFILSIKVCALVCLLYCYFVSTILILVFVLIIVLDCGLPLY